MTGGVWGVGVEKRVGYREGGVPASLFQLGGWGGGGGEESSYPLMTLCDMWLTPGKKSSMIGVEPIVSYIIFQCVDTRFPPCARMEVEPIFR